MKRYILGLTTAAILCSPFAYADDTMGQDPQMTAPTTTDSMPSTPTTTTDPSTNTTTTTQDTTTTTDVQLKTLDGKIIHVQIAPQDLQGMTVGDKLEVTDLGTSGTTSSGASTTGTSSPDTSNGTTTNGNGNMNQ